MNKDENEIYLIMDIKKYSEYIRKQAASSFSNDYHENLDEFITLWQVSDMIIKYSVGQDEKKRYMIDENNHEKLLEEMTERIYNSGLSKLAAKDEIECAWDSEKNKMIFWAKKRN
jgi:hypothetical protein